VNVLKIGGFNNAINYVAECNCVINDHDLVYIGHVLLFAAFLNDEVDEPCYSGSGNTALARGNTASEMGITAFARGNPASASKIHLMSPKTSNCVGCFQSSCFHIVGHN